MTPQEQARMAYSSPSAPIRTTRGTEYEAFVEITRALKSASTPGRGSFKDLVTALHRNRQLWTILASSVADRENGLPVPLRARLFYLYEFTVHHTSEVLAGRAGADALIEINTTVMQGLVAGGAER